MKLANDSEYANTERKLQRIEEQIARAKQRGTSAENDESVQALSKIAAQLQAELALYRSRIRTPVAK